MTLTDARKILGLAPDDDPRIHISEFRLARERIAELVRTAPNDTLADRYQKGLLEFDKALAAVHEYIDSLQPGPDPLPATVVGEDLETPAAAPVHAKTIRLPDAMPAPKVPMAAVISENTPAAPATIESEEKEPAEAPKRGRRLSVFAWLLILLIAGSGGAWLYLQNERALKEQRQTRIAFLERNGSVFIENRRWPEASAAFAEIEKLSPGSEIASLGRRSIEAGMNEEQTQFSGYWIGQAQAELEAGRLDEATAAARQVLDKFPGNQDAAAIISRITAARADQSRKAAITAARAQIDQRKWKDAIQTATTILSATPDDADAKSIIADANAALEKAAANQSKAAQLLKNALARDQGQFDQQALDWLREAKSLDPENPQISALLEKLSSYKRTLRVPGDFATPDEALAQAHDQDRIILGPQTWKGPLVINAAVDLQSEDPTRTTVECTPENGSAITIGPGAKGARVTGITFRHESFAVGADRFAVALVRGGNAIFTDCRFLDASGHGLAVIEKGSAVADRCRFSNNGWNGAAAIGGGSSLEVKESESIGNFEHGIETWDGASATIVNNRCEANSRNGIHTDNGSAAAIITGNQLIANREFGLVVDSAASGKISGNVARVNLLGGIVIRTGAAKLPVTKNQATLNEGPGLVLEKGLPAASYSDNMISQNLNQQVLPDANLSQQDDPSAVKEETPPAAIIVEPAPKR